MQYKYLSTQATTVVAPGPAFLDKITVNTAVSTATITVYDDLTAVAANKVATVDGNVVGTRFYGVRMKRGITIVTATANPDATVVYD